MYKNLIIAVAAATILAMPGSGLASEHDEYTGPSNSESARYQGNPLPWWWNKSEGGGRSSFASAPDELPKGKGHHVKK
jgi:hypothetical protein